MARKKAQIAGQIFIFMLALVVFGGIMIYGYKSISEFRNKADSVSMLQLSKDMQTSVKKISSDYGTVLRKELSIPTEYDEVCFVQSDATPNPIQSIDFCNGQHTIICDYWKDASPQNMFLMKTGVSQKDFAVGNIKIEGGVLCVEVTQAKVVLKLEGKGNYVQLSKWG